MQTKKIQLSTHGYEVLVDEENFERLSQIKWNLHNNHISRGIIGNLYADGYPRIDGKITYHLMHRFIMKAEKGQQIDHINGNGLDNRKENLRFVTQTENNLNRKHIKNKSGFVGVYKNPKSKRDRWMAMMRIGKKNTYLGSFDTPEEAHRVYLQNRIKIYGKEYAKIR